MYNKLESPAHLASFAALTPRCPCKNIVSPYTTLSQDPGKKGDISEAG